MARICGQMVFDSSNVFSFLEVNVLAAPVVMMANVSVIYGIYISERQTCEQAAKQ